MKRVAIAILLLGLSTPMALAATKTTNGSGAIIRILDRTTGALSDHEMASGSTVQKISLTVTLRQCRYPRRAINRDAFASFLISDPRREKPVFNGWMVASSPALSAMEHPRYDVWVIKCLAPK